MYEKITLENLKGGIVEERFQYELNRVLENISDPNTDHRKPREVNIKLVFNSDEERENIAFSLVVTSKLAPVKTIGGKLALSAAGEQPGLFQETSKEIPLPIPENNQELKIGGLNVR